MKERESSEQEKKSEYREMLDNLIKTYVNRSDCFANQIPSGEYYCVRSPITPSLIHEHLLGRATIGVYTLSKDNTAKYVVLDADDEENMDKLEKVFVEFDAPSYLENSRRGGHLWFFFENPVEGKLARNFGMRVAEMYGVNAEVFPKQAETKGTGSCIRLPFGTHRKTGKKYHFEGFSSLEEELWEMSNPAGRVSFETINKYQYEEPKKERKTYGEISELPIWEKIKRVITVKELVEQFVDLDSKGKGHCPFHDDGSPSFSVNEKENYWNCFAGCGGGSVVDFWMKLNHMEFKEAVDDLAERLGLT